VLASERIVVVVYDGVRGRRGARIGNVGWTRVHRRGTLDILRRLWMPVRRLRREGSNRLTNGLTGSASLIVRGRVIVNVV
jgi:hypothetical protein